MAYWDRSVLCTVQCSGRTVPNEDSKVSIFRSSLVLSAVIESIVFVRVSMLLFLWITTCCSRRMTCSLLPDVDGRPDWGLGPEGNPPFCLPTGSCLLGELAFLLEAMMGQLCLDWGSNIELVIPV